MTNENKQPAGEPANEQQASDAAPQPSGHPRYHFKAHEKIPHGIKRMVLEQIDRASQCLTTRADGIDASIHDARVCFKKIRALLRLVRGEMDDRNFIAENVRFRDAGRRLSTVRDSAVAIDTFDKLTRDSRILVEQELQRLRASLVLTEATPLAEKEKALSEVVDVIRIARDAAGEWQLRQRGFSALAPGLKLVYGDGRTEFEAALDRPTIEALHELRKHVKNLWYQMHVLGGAWPAVLEALIGQLEELADLLSDHHDLAVLQQAVSGVPGFRSDSDPWASILALIDRRQRELRMQAMPLGERVYVEKPGAFVRRIEGYWNAWRPKLS
jgi:CHAD domain-containing protein